MLAVDGIDVFYGDVQALWDVSLRVESGEIVTIIGANGAGKTTTLRAIAGLMKPRRGKVILDGADVTGVAPNEMVGRGLVLVPEAPLLVREVFESLKSIREQGVTIVLVEQNVPHALALADRAVVLETGRVTLSGAASELVRDDRIRDAYLGLASV